MYYRYKNLFREMWNILQLTTRYINIDGKIFYMVNLDQKDREILEILKKEAKLTTRQISKRTHIPITTVHNRIKKLEHQKIITGYRAVIDKKKMGKALGAFIHITIQYPEEPAETFQENVAHKIASLPEVEEVSIVTGETDIIVKIHVSDTDELNGFVVRKLRTIKGIDKTRTSVIMEHIS